MATVVYDEQSKTFHMSLSVKEAAFIALMVSNIEDNGEYLTIENMSNRIFSELNEPKTAEGKAAIDDYYYKLNKVIDFKDEIPEATGDVDD